MNRRYVPEPDAVLTVLAGRVDAVERQLRLTDERLAGVAEDVAALGRGMADLVAQIRQLGTSAPAAVVTPAGDDDVDEGELAEPQRDWMTVTDPVPAAQWLDELATWTTDVLAPHDAAPAAICWPLHPDVVAELMALQADRDAAYDGDRPTPVSEWLARWLPSASQRIGASLAHCIAERGHHADGRTYDATVLDLASVAGWWTEHRGRPAADVLALPAIP
jgi:hypothetical protein